MTINPLSSNSFNPPQKTLSTHREVDGKLAPKAKPLSRSVPSTTDLLLLSKRISQENRAKVEEKIDQQLEPANFNALVEKITKNISDMKKIKGSFDYQPKNIENFLKDALTGLKNNLANGKSAGTGEEIYFKVEYEGYVTIMGEEDIPEDPKITYDIAKSRYEEITKAPDAIISNSIDLNRIKTGFEFFENHMELVAKNVLPKNDAAYDKLFKQVMDSFSSLIKTTYEIQTKIETNLNAYIFHLPGQEPKIYLNLLPLGKGTFKYASMSLNISDRKVKAVLVTDLSQPKNFMAAKKDEKFIRQLAEAHKTFKKTNIFEFNNYADKVSKQIIVQKLFHAELETYSSALEEAGEHLDQKQMIDIFNELLTQLKSIHMAEIVHKDIKLENILLKIKNNIIKLLIMDFGFAADGKDQDDVSYARGTLLYLAPELLQNMINTAEGKEKLVADKSIDVWALGITFGLLAGNKGVTAIFDGFSHANLISKMPEILEEMVEEAKGTRIRPSKPDHPLEYQLWELCNDILDLKKTYNNAMSILDQQFIDQLKEVQTIMRNQPEPPDPIQHLIWEMLQVNPADRISIDDALAKLAFIALESQLSELFKNILNRKITFEDAKGTLNKQFFDQLEKINNLVNNQPEPKDPIQHLVWEMLHINPANRISIDDALAKLAVIVKPLPSVGKLFRIDSNSSLDSSTGTDSTGYSSDEDFNSPR